MPPAAHTQLNRLYDRQVLGGSGCPAFIPPAAGATGLLVLKFFLSPWHNVGLCIPLRTFPSIFVVGLVVR